MGFRSSFVFLTSAAATQTTRPATKPNVVAGLGEPSILRP